MTLYLVRHGETEENLQRILQGHMPGILTDKGKQQVRATAEQLAKETVSFSRIVSSDLQRAIDSAKIIANRLNDGKTLPIVPMEILRERDWKNLTGMTIADAADKFRIDGKWNFPEGSVETEEEIYERATKALEMLKNTYNNETIIVVTHGLFLRNLIAAHFKCDFREVTPFINAEIRTLTL